MSGESRVESRGPDIPALTGIDQHYECGRHAALRGCWRVLCNAPAKEEFVAWYAGFDSVPRELRGKGPLTGPIPDDLLARLADCGCTGATP